jgi:hypothetical protein
MAIDKKLIDQLLADYKKPEDIIGENGLLKQLTKAVLERALEAEMTEHLGYEKHDPGEQHHGNPRNGKSRKTLQGDFGELELETPRDRQATFEPRIVRKRQTRWTGFDDKILSMYARGMTTREIQGHLEEIYGIEVSPTLISNVTEAVIEEVRRLMQLWGQSIDPHSAWLIERGLRTLGVRLARHSATGQTVAEWFNKQPQVATVHYPGLASHRDHKTAKRVLEGYGGMLGVELKGGARAAERFLRALTIAAHAPSLGGTETLVSEPRLTSHRSLSPDQRAEAGIPDGFLRFSLGLEDADDLIADFAQALAQL